VRLSDAKPAVLNRLGPPDKMESEPLAGNVDPTVPAVWPRQSRYHWRLGGHLVSVTFLDQAQKIDDTHVLAKDTVVSIDLNK
jgi:hypothetical protein